MDTRSILCVASTEYMQDVENAITASVGDFTVDSAADCETAINQLTGANHDCLVVSHATDSDYGELLERAYSTRVPIVVCNADEEKWTRETVSDTHHTWVHTTLPEEYPTEHVPQHLHRVISDQQLTLELLNRDYLSALLGQYAYTVDTASTQTEIKEDVCQTFVDAGEYSFAAVVTLASDHSGFVIEQGAGFDHLDLPTTVELAGINDEFASAIVDTYIEDADNVCFNLDPETVSPLAQEPDNVSEFYPDGVSILTTPLSRETVDFGILMLGSNQPAGFDARERTMLVYLARWGAHALHRLDTESQLAQIEKNLRNRDAQIDAIVGALSHDLRNPLNTAKGYTDRAIETGDVEHLDWVVKSHERMINLVNDVVELAQTRDIEHHETTLDLGDVVKNVWAKIDTPDGAELDVRSEATVGADAERLRTMLELLFQNSINYGGDDVTVTVRSTANGFSIADDGKGFDTDDMEKLFRAGYSTSSSSTGLGLTIVKRIVDAHEWDIEASPSESGGAKFTIHTSDI